MPVLSTEDKAKNVTMTLGFEGLTVESIERRDAGHDGTVMVRCTAAPVTSTGQPRRFAFTVNAPDARGLRIGDAVEMIVVVLPQRSFRLPLWRLHGLEQPAPVATHRGSRRPRAR